MAQRRGRADAGGRGVLIGGVGQSEAHAVQKEEKTAYHRKRGSVGGKCEGR